MFLNQLTIVQAQKGLKKKEFSAAELTKAVFKEIKKRGKEINSYLTLTEDLALAQADKIDQRIKNKEKLGGLAGIPISVKDNILVEGVRCAAGSKILRNYTAPYDAAVVKKLKEAGAVLVGKTNLDEFGMGSSTENSAFGPVKNPHDLERVAGGSSGGSAAAVAADFCLGSLGTDTGGSIRLPSSFCGAVGLKPTYGAVSRYGLIAFASSLDQIGPIAKTSQDARIIFDTIKGKDEMDSTSCHSEESRFSGTTKNPVDNRDSSILRDPSASPQNDIKNLKIGLPKEYFVEGLDQGVEKAIKRAIQKYQDLGAKIIEVSLPNIEYALACYYIIMTAEASANLARYDGVKYGVSERAADLLKGYLKTREKGFGEEARRRIMIGTYVLSAGYYDAYYLKAQKVRTLIKDDFVKAFKKVDILLAPVSPTPAFKIGEKTDDPVKMYLSDIYTVSVNLAGLPAMSLPCAEVSGLPVGFQLIAGHFEEDKIFRVARLYEKG